MTDTEFDVGSFEDRLIADMRANDGKVTSGPLAGHPLLIMTSRGARSGAERRAILTWTRDGDDYVVAGTAGGSPTTPSWVHNVAEDPQVEIEVDNATTEATARVVDDEADRQRLWDQHVARLPWFAPYPEQSGRLIPMIRITPARD
jgi:deazaflavin-dependent oxidoreductase (nitroreductase family)